MAKIEKIMNSSNCYGCGACVNRCASNAITMELDEKGFPYPRINPQKCSNCNLCYSVCPAVKENADLPFHKNEPLAVYSVRNKDMEIRKNSSSGGLFAALSDYVLAQGGVVCGVVWKDDFSVEHVCAVTAEDRDRMKLSKYVQSDTGKCYSDIRSFLEAGKLVMFTGTPCQTAGLRLFLGTSDFDRLILCDVLCGGNVSPGLFRDYIAYIEGIRKDRAVSVCFRTKKLGWKQHHIRVVLEKSLYEGARKDHEPFFELYLKKYSIRESCFSCGFASIKRVSDITMGDFWGLEKAAPEIDDDIGISLAMANAEKGLNILTAISAQVDMEPRTIELAVPRQVNLRTPPTPPKQRAAFWNDYARKGGRYVLRKYTVFGPANRAKQMISKAICKVKLK